MSKATDVADALRKAANATTLAEQQGFVRQAEELKSAHHEAAFGGGEWSAEDAVIRDTLVPGFTHELHTASTDWLTDLDDSVDKRQASQNMIAEASLWYGRVSDEVKSYGSEYSEQAKNLAHRLAGQYGDFADEAERVFLDEASRLRTTAVRAGIVVEAGDAGETPDSAKGPAQKAFEAKVERELDKDRDGNIKDRDFKANEKHASYEDEADDEADPNKDDDWFEPKTSGLSHYASSDLFAVLAASEGTEDTTGNPGVYNDNPALTSSNRAPAIPELQQSSPVVKANDPGLGQTDDLTGANNAPINQQDHASKGTFPVQGAMNKESSMGQQYAGCPTCGGHGKVAVRQRELPSILDISKEGVSGLDQIDQTVDPHDNGPKPTSLPVDVAFPWTLNPQQQVPAAINQAEEQISQRNSLSPLLQNQSKQPAARQSVQSAYHTAGGRDNSGWMGDNGARGTDYPGYQIGQYPAPSTSEGYVDPAHGNGGETGQNGGVKPYGAQEASDRGSVPSQWQPGMPTQMDQGWRETVAQDPALQSAAAFLEQRHAAYLKAQRG